MYSASFARARLALLLLLATVGLPGNAGADTATGPMDEIVVSSLRETSLREAPTSVTTLDRTDIRQLAVQQMRRVLQENRFAPLSQPGAPARPTVSHFGRELKTGGDVPDTGTQRDYVGNISDSEESIPS